MTFAICVRCGQVKKGPSFECPNCHFTPKSDRDKAKSIILSLAYEIDGDYKGKTKVELQDIAKDIQAGKPYDFDEHEVDRVVEYARQVMDTFPRRLFVDGIKWLGPPLAILAAGLAFLYFRK